MEKQTGCVHIYCGDGKGKTTCGMGLCTRAAGYGYRVLIYQFMKDNSTSERKVLLLSPNVTFVPGQDKIKFSFLMTPEEKAEQKRYYEEQFQKVTEKAVQEEYDVLFLDELVYTIGSKLFDEQLLLDFLDHKPEKLEVILTGQGPSEALIERADYVSELKKSSIRLTRVLRQEMESSGNAEKTRKRYCFAGKMIPCRTVSFS